MTSTGAKLGPLDGLNLEGIDWVIAGGESGNNHRPMDIRWARDILDKCLEAEVPSFFKQWRGRIPKTLGRDLDGQTWDQMPLITDARGMRRLAT